MTSNKVNETKDPIDLTIGKVRGAIKNLNTEGNDIKVQRALDLFEKVVKYLDEVKPIRI